MTCKVSMITILQAFNSKLSKPSLTGCIEWLGTKQPNGYGVFRAGRNSVGTDLAHRFIWLATNGPIENGLHVLHRCDNALCCNVGHLFLGTPKDNMLDKKTKGRTNNGITCGEGNHKAKLTDVQVTEILLDTRSCLDIAAHYNVGRTQVWRIKTGRARTKSGKFSTKKDKYGIYTKETCCDPA